MKNFKKICVSFVKILQVFIKVSYNYSVLKVEIVKIQLLLFRKFCKFKESMDEEGCWWD